MGRYLLTGAAGFIGSYVCRELLRHGHQVLGVDDLNDAYDVRLKEWRLAQLQERRGFSFQRLDISHRDALRQGASRWPGRWDGIINLAARAGVRQSLTDPWVYVHANITGTVNLLALAVERDVEKFVLASTSGLYGNSNPTPFREDANTDRPLSPYTASKKAAEAMCHAYHYLYDLDVSVLRYFTVYGPAGRPDMSLFRFVKWISEGQRVTVYGDGGQERDFTYVEDAARGTVAALRELGHEIINLGSDRPVALREAIATIEHLVGKPAQLTFEDRHPADIRTTWADISKARSLLDWEPATALEVGLGAMVDWYRENRNWARHVETGD